MIPAEVAIRLSLYGDGKPPEGWRRMRGNFLERYFPCADETKPSYMQRRAYVHVGLADDGEAVYWRARGDDGPRQGDIGHGRVAMLTEAIAAGVAAVESWMAQPVGSGS